MGQEGRQTRTSWSASELSYSSVTRRLAEEDPYAVRIVAIVVALAATVVGVALFARAVVIIVGVVPVRPADGWPA